MMESSGNKNFHTTKILTIGTDNGNSKAASVQFLESSLPKMVGGEGELC
jgi:hypothetical protein